jgi:hypothetical protein
MIVVIRYLFLYLLADTIIRIDCVDVADIGQSSPSYDEYGKSSQSSFDDPFDEANRYLSIVNEQFDAAETLLSQFIDIQEEEDLDNNIKKNFDYYASYQKHIDKTIIAYQQAIRVYNEIVRKALIDRIEISRHSDIYYITTEEINMLNLEIWTANLYLANTYYSLAELYYLLLTSPIVELLRSSSLSMEQKTNRSNEKLALKYYQNAYDGLEILLRQTKNDDKDDTKQNINIEYDENNITVVVDKIMKLESELLLAYCSMRVGSVLLYNQPILGLTTSSNKQILDLQQQYQQNEATITTSLANIVEKASVTDLWSYFSDPSKLNTIINDKMNLILSELEEQQQQQQLGKTNNNMHDSITNAKRYYDDAERLFRKLLDDDNDYTTRSDLDKSISNNSSKLYLKRHLAAVLFAAAEIAVYENDYVSASFYYEESMVLNKETIEFEQEQQQQNNQNQGAARLESEPATTMKTLSTIYSTHDAYISDHDGVIENSRKSILDVLYALSDIYLRQGKYEFAKDRYRRASKYYCCEHVSLNQILF